MGQAPKRADGALNWQRIVELEYFITSINSVDAAGERP
jgi:hypothetical protein